MKSVIKNVDPVESSFSQKASSSELSFEDIGVSLPDEHLTPDQKHEASGLLDLFKDPYRCIPPAMFEEVRQHIKEMLDAGAIRESQSPFSSNSLGAESRKKSYAKHFGYKLATGLPLKKNEF